MVILEIEDSFVEKHEREIGRVPEPVFEVSPRVLEVELDLLIVAFVYSVGDELVVVTDHHLDHLDTLSEHSTQVR